MAKYRIEKIELDPLEISMKENQHGLEVDVKTITLKNLVIPQVKAVLIEEPQLGNP